jgi:hypothetical protein
MPMRFSALVLMSLFAVVMIVLLVTPMRMRMVVLMIVAMSRCCFVTFVFVLMFVRHISISSL